MMLKQLIHDLRINIVGMAILGVGLLAVLLVGVLVYRTLAGPSADNNGVEISREEINSFKQETLSESSATSKKQGNASFKRQKSISEKQVIGSWSTRIQGGRALLQIEGGTYRLIIVMDNPAASRWYSNGRYTLQDDLLMLAPNLAWGAPQSKKYGYRVLTRAKMPVIVSKHKGRLVWQIPGPDADVYVPNYHPLLSQTRDKIAVWSVLK